MILVTILFLLISIGSSQTLGLNFTGMLKGSFNIFDRPTTIDLSGPFYSVQGYFNETLSRFNFLLLLYTNESVLADANCGLFESFTCDANSSCIEYTDDFHNITYPFYEIEGDTVTTNFFFKDYSMSNHQRIFNYAKKCDGNNGLLIPFKGAIGLGKVNSGPDFLQAPVFSLYLSKTEGGSLIIGEDSLKETGKPNIIKGVSKNWEIPIEGIEMGYESDFQGRAIFDITAPYIGVPSHIFRRALKYLDKFFNVKCNNVSLIDFICTIPTGIDSLPSFYLYSPNGQNHISITPDIYFQPFDDEEKYTFAMRGLTTDPTKQNYTLINTDFQDCIILGSPFLKYYYVLFDSSDPSNWVISYYVADHSIFNSVIIYYVIFVLALLLAVGLIVLIVSKIKRGRRVEPVLATPLLEEKAVSEKEVGTKDNKSEINIS